jgi:glycosyltransferase involved in cell wall biosynthesis
MDKEITIVIPTRNEIGYLPDLVRCLENQTFENFATIVVDHHSTDGTRQFCQAKAIPVVDGGHPDKAKNIGAELSPTEYILFLDADVLIGSDFIEESLKTTRCLGADSLSFLLEPIEDSKTARFLYKIASLYLRVTNGLGFPHGIGSALLVRREAHHAVNGFDESITVAEDYDYTARISKKYQHFFVREPKVKVSARRLLREGTFKYSLKCVCIELHRILLGEIRDNRVKYFQEKK